MQIAHYPAPNKFIETHCKCVRHVGTKRKFLPEGEIYFQPGATPQVCRLKNKRSEGAAIFNWTFA